MVKNNNHDLSVTDAVLRQYDSGNTAKGKILATLMATYPMLTLHTIDEILRVHRHQKKPEKTSQPRSKSPIELAEEKILQKCNRCPIHQSGRYCVMPLGLCPFPDIDEDMKHLSELIKKKSMTRGEIKVKGGKIVYQKRKSSARKQQDIVDAFEQDLDNLMIRREIEKEAEGNPYCLPGPFMSHVVEGAFFEPDAPMEQPIGLARDESFQLSEFADVLAPRINPTVQRDTFNFPIDEGQSNSLMKKFNKYYGDLLPADENEEIQQEFSNANFAEENLEFSDDMLDFGEKPSEDDEIFAPQIKYTTSLSTTPYENASEEDADIWNSVLAAAINRINDNGDEPDFEYNADEMLSYPEREEELQEESKDNAEDDLANISLADFADILSPDVLNAMKGE